ncbi:MAG: hypothetical protein F7C35_07825 [Desulfurococcales archaeon]|nr:hypothetical protein [Desulfurococcales archaeon]
MNYWDILLGLTGATFVLAGLFLYLALYIRRTPTGVRLALVAGLFLLEAVIGLVVYYRWEEAGYGPDISVPLIGLQLATLTGLAILIDIVRR